MDRIRVVALPLVLCLLAAPAAEARAPADPLAEPDLVIASHGRQLSAAEVRAADVTDSPVGRATIDQLAAEPDFAWLRRRPSRVLRFGEHEIVADAATALSVFSGRNRAGLLVYEVVPAARPAPVSAQAGYAGPPDGSSAWVYNTSGYFSSTYNNWRRNIAWTIMAAWNYRLCSTCTAYQYFRIYGSIQGGTIAGADSKWRRLWLEFDSTDGWGGAPADFEFGEPAESVPGPNHVEITVGFANGVTIQLGAPPLTASGSHSTNYQGKISIPDEYWYPVLRDKIGSGGVGYCRLNAWNHTRKISTRQGIRQAVNAQLGGWHILYGMQLSYKGCPGV